MKKQLSRILSILSSVAVTIVLASSCGGEEPVSPTPDPTPTPTPTTVAVTGVSLSKTSMTLTEGGSETLTATITPSDATNKNVTWSSSDSGVATVSNGQVTAVKPGTAAIIVATADGGKTATCTVTVEAKKVPVTGVTLDKESVELVEGEEVTLAATIAPENATEKSVEWSSSNAEVATVTDGKVTAVKPGTATITVKTKDGGKTAACEITVIAKTISVEGVALDKETLEMTEGDEVTLIATVTPEDASDPSVEWSTSAAKVATVTDGKVTAVKAGTATITVKTKDGGKTAKCKITVKEKTYPVEKVTLSKTSLSLKEGESAELTASITPENASNKSVTFSSSNESVATVDSEGKVTAVKAGSATITVKTVDGGKTATCKVTVEKKKVPVTGVSVNKKYTLLEGETVELTATVAPEDATNKNVTWSSSKESIAKVDKNGKVTAVAAGTAVITVKTEDGGKTAKCEITVMSKSVPADGVKLDRTSLTLMESKTQQLTATITPSNATDHDLTWSSSDDKIATVDNTGKVTAVKAGTATITVKTKNNKSATCKVTVNTRYTVMMGNTEITENYTLSITPGQTVTLMPYDKVNNVELRSTLSSDSITSTNSNQVKVDLMYGGGAGGIAIFNGWNITSKQNGGSATVTMKYGSLTRKINVKVKEYTVWYNNKEVGSSMTFHMVAKSEGIHFQLYDKTSGSKVQLTNDNRDYYTITSSNHNVTTDENAYALYGKNVGCVGEGTTTLTFKYQGVTIKTTSLRIVHDCDIYYNGSKLGSSMTAYKGNHLYFKLYDKVDKKFIILHNGSSFTTQYNNLACSSTSTSVLRFSGVHFENSVGDSKLSYADGVGTSTLTFTYYGKEIARTTITVKEGRIGITTSDYSVYGPLEESSSAATNFLVYKKNGQKRVFKFYDFDMGGDHKPSSDKMISPLVTLGPGSYNSKFTIAITGNQGEICFYQQGASSNEQATLYFQIRRSSSDPLRTVYVSLQNAL